MLEYESHMLGKSLNGIRVLDLTRLYPGPLSTLMLADMGAEVIKIEAPEGELARYFPPYQFGSGANFLHLNRGKRSLTLNLKKQKGVEILKRLLERTDVLVESFRPGVMKRFKLDYDNLRHLFPSLIYCSISGYGQKGPDAHKPGHDLNYLSVAAIIGLNRSEGRYVIPPIQIADILGGFQASTAICAALYQRTREGKGKFLDISLLDGAFFCLIGLLSLHFAGSPVTPESLPLSGRLACYNLYRTKDDRYLAIALLEPKFWRTFCLKLNLHQYMNHQLQEDQAELIDALTEIFAQRDLQDWLEFFSGDDLCLTPVNDFLESLSYPQFLYRKMLLNVSYPSGILRQLRTPFVENTDATSRAPLPGEHNVEILSEYGYSGDEIASLKNEGIL